ncbi:MAG: acetyl-CoA carboxylase biotin carboxyl carrier protein [Phycisphaerales bacterium]|nr:acetyl-CoA carboxylase biotin carboxyl carrier protein [Phycisphaerales bacterium]
MKIDDIKRLIELMVENDLSRIEIDEGDSHVLLKRGEAHPRVEYAPLPPQMPMPAAAPAPAVTPAAAPPPAPAASATEHVIRSPMVGTYYSAADPESPPFVKVGDVISPESVVCLVEAMKVFNEIKAETSGRIARVLVSNGQAVEYDQPLFALEPA